MLIIKVLTKVDQVTMNIEKPMSLPITEIEVVFFGVQVSSIRDMITKVNNNKTPMLARSTHVGGRINTLIPMNNTNTNGQINKFTQKAD